MAECLDIWVSCITFKNELLLNIYGEDSSQSTEIVTMLIDQGLFSETASLRRQFKDAIEFMSFNIKTGTLPIAPAIFFLQKLLHLEQIFACRDTVIHCFVTSYNVCEICLKHRLGQCTIIYNKFSYLEWLIVFWPA